MLSFFNSQRYLFPLVVIAAFLFTVFWLRSSNQVPDDAFISLRYAQHLAEGLGFRFNPGWERVEGFSSPLHVVLLAGSILLGVAPLAASQLSSILPGFLLLMAFFVWSRKILGRVWGFAAALALAVNPAFTIWSRGGLETTLFALWIFLVLVAGIERRWSIMGILGGLIALTRPEGMLYWLPVAGWMFFFARNDDGKFGGAVKKMCWMPAIYLPWLIFRFLYFQDFFPNTYYAKMDGVRLAQINRGANYLWDFLGRNDLRLAEILAIMAAIFVLNKSGWKFRTGTVQTWQILALGLAVCAATFVLLSGGDHMAQHRFLLPIIPIILLFGAWGGKTLAELAAQSSLRVAVQGLLLLVFLSPHALVFNKDLRNPINPLHRPVGLVEPWGSHGIPGLFKLGLKLGEILPHTATLALVPAGALPYASELPCIDMLGLNDKEIARQHVSSMGRGRMGHEKGSGAIIMSRKPDYILLRTAPAPVDAGVQDPREHSLDLTPVRELWLDEGFHQQYEPFVVPVDENLAFTLFRRKMDSAQ